MSGPDNARYQNPKPKGSRYSGSGICATAYLKFLLTELQDVWVRAGSFGPRSSDSVPLWGSRSSSLGLDGGADCLHPAFRRLLCNEAGLDESADTGGLTPAARSRHRVAQHISCISSAKHVQAFSCSWTRASLLPHRSSIGVALVGATSRQDTAG